MATKRFDDVAETARALEAQAKKLRREAQAARTKAYADALVAVFPEVKGMGSAEEVLDFVKGLKPGTGHETPDACSALLDDFRVANDPPAPVRRRDFPCGVLASAPVQVPVRPVPPLVPAQSALRSHARPKRLL